MLYIKRFSMRTHLRFYKYCNVYIKYFCEKSVVACFGFSVFSFNALNLQVVVLKVFDKIFTSRSVTLQQEHI